MSQIEDEGDLTRKQRREQARADRKAMEEADAADAARRKRLTRLGVVVAVVVAAVVVILVATSSGGSKALEKPGSKSEPNKVENEVSTLLAGIHQSGNSLGSPTAPVTLQYYGDLECPICRKFTEGALAPLIRHWVKEGKLRIEYHNLETATREPETFKTQQAAALAAGKQAKLWNFIETFYHEQGAEDSGYVTEQYLRGIAQQVPGLNLAQWTNERTKPVYASEIESDAQSANAQGFTGTPSFLIGHTGGAAKNLEYSSLEDPSSFNQAIEQQLKA